METEQLDMQGLDDGSFWAEFVTDAIGKAPKRILDDGTETPCDFYLRIIRLQAGKRLTAQILGDRWQLSTWQAAASDEEGENGKIPRQDRMLRTMTESMRAAVEETSSDGAVRVEAVRQGRNNAPFHWSAWYEGQGDENGGESEAGGRKGKSGDGGGLAALANAQSTAIVTSIRTAANMAGRAEDRAYQAGQEVGAAAASADLLTFYMEEHKKLSGQINHQGWASSAEKVAIEWAGVAREMVQHPDALVQIVDRAASAVVAMASAIAASRGAPAPDPQPGPAPGPQPPPSPEAAREDMRRRILATLARAKAEGLVTDEDIAAAMGGAP